MNHGLRILVSMPLLAACTAHAPVPDAPSLIAAVQSQSHPQVLALEQPELKLPRFCHVSSDCMDLDPAPFSPCQVSSEPCQGEGGFMQVTPGRSLTIETVESLPPR